MCSDPLRKTLVSAGPFYEDKEGEKDPILFFKWVLDAQVGAPKPKNVFHCGSKGGSPEEDPSQGAEEEGSDDPEECASIGKYAVFSNSICESAVSFEQ